uniref:Uncharacterized protein n=1 Tax=Opuntia streptacantha TaxID=393608 RepID=A0A7C9EA44_OPUST
MRDEARASLRLKMRREATKACASENFKWSWEKKNKKTLKTLKVTSGVCILEAPKKLKVHHRHSTSPKTGNPSFCRQTQVFSATLLLSFNLKLRALASILQSTMEDLAVAKHANAEEEGSDTDDHRLHIVMETSFDITLMADHI